MVSHHKLVSTQMVSPKNGDTRGRPPPPPPSDATDVIYYTEFFFVFLLE